MNSPVKTPSSIEGSSTEVRFRLRKKWVFALTVGPDGVDISLNCDCTPERLSSVPSFQPTKLVALARVYQ